MVQAQEEAGSCPTQKSSPFLLWAAQAKEAQVSQQVCAKTFCRCSLDKSAKVPCSGPGKSQSLGWGLEQERRHVDTLGKKGGVGAP